MLPWWFQYYSAHFEVEDIFVLHHTVPSAAHDPCTDHLPSACNVINVSNEYFDPVWLREVVCQQQRALLESYNIVLFAEVDEIIVPDRRFYPTGLQGYLSAFARGEQLAVRCTGWELHHNIAASEPAVDLGRPLLTQRGFWHRNELYDKALVTQQPLQYGLGFHTCEQAVDRDDGLLLLHLHKYDFNSYLRRHEERAVMRHSDDAIRNGWNEHYRRSGGQLVAQFLSIPSPLEPLPEWLKESNVV